MDGGLTTGLIKTGQGEDICGGGVERTGLVRMNGFQINNPLNIIPETVNLFRGCYYKRNIPLRLFNERTCFFILKTKTDFSRCMDHWILFYIRDHNLLIIDSFAIEPRFMGGTLKICITHIPGVNQ